MELHEFMCPEPAMAGMEAVLRDPAILRRYPSQLTMLCDFAADTVHIRAASGAMVPVSVSEAERPKLYPHHNGPRNARLVRNMKDRVRRPFVANMLDAAPFDAELYLGQPLNILQHNRRPGNRTAVLWRLDNYWEPTPNMGGLFGRRVADAIPFPDKKPVIFWRGRLHGQHWASAHEIERLRHLWSRATSEADLRTVAARYPRAAAVLFGRDNPAISDIYFMRPETEPEFPPSHPGHRYFGLPVPPAEQLENRYLLCLPGIDVSSQLYWAVQTNCLAFKVEAQYECLPDYFLKPWVHYVPVAANLNDLRDKYEFCESHPRVAEDIIRRAQDAHRRMLDAAAWREAEDIVLDRLGLRD